MWTDGRCYSPLLCALLCTGRLACLLKKLRTFLNLIKNKFKLVLTITEISYWCLSWPFFALVSIPTSKYYFKMWEIWISVICFLLSVFAKLNNSSPASHQERVKSRREEAQQVLLPIWSGKQNVSMSQIGAEIVLLPFWACSTTERQKPCLKPVSVLCKV